MSSRFEIVQFFPVRRCVYGFTMVTLLTEPTEVWKLADLLFAYLLFVVSRKGVCLV